MKARVTVTVDRELLRAAERRAGRRSRSYAVEQALRDSARLAIARETIAYYRSLNAAEREDEKSWGTVAATAAAALADLSAAGR